MIVYNSYTKAAPNASQAKLKLWPKYGRAANLKDRLSRVFSGLVVTKFE